MGGRDVDTVVQQTRGFASLHSMHGKVAWQMQEAAALTGAVCLPCLSAICFTVGSLMRWGVWSPLFCRAALSGVPKGEYAVRCMFCSYTGMVSIAVECCNYCTKDQGMNVISNEGLAADILTISTPKHQTCPTCVQYPIPTFPSFKC